MIYVYIVFLILGKVILGGYFLMNAFSHFKNYKMLAGYSTSKGIPESMAIFAVIITGIMMALGGVGLILGVYMDVTILILSVFLLGVTFMMHKYWKVTDPMARMGERINFYKNLALLGSLWMILPLGNTPIWEVFKFLFGQLG